MTDVSSSLAAVRRGLDAAAQQATAATQGPWELTEGREWLAEHVVFGPSLGWSGHIAQVANVEYGQNKEADAAHIVAWDPAHVTAHVGSLRTICDGIEATLERHYPTARYLPEWFWCEALGDRGQMVTAQECPDLNAAVSSLAGLAAVWAPTEQETP